MKASNTIKQVVVRLNPITNTPVIFDALSKDRGQLKAYVSGEEKIVGVDYYAHTQQLTLSDATKVARDFAKHQGIPEDEIIVRMRLPKQPPTVQKNRRLNDANLVLVGNEKKADEGKADNLAQAAQQLHDNETGKKGASKQNEQKSSPENPEGAVVTPRKKRQYRKSSEREISKRSQAAMLRYQQELAASAAKSPTLLEPVAATANQETIDKATFELAMALSKILKAHNVL